MIRFFDHPSRLVAAELVAPTSSRFEQATVSATGERTTTSRDLATYDAAVTAYVNAIGSLLDEGYVERPAHVTLRRNADGTTRMLQLPAFCSIPSDSSDDDRKALRATIERAVAAYHDELARLRADGFELTIADWHDGIAAPTAPFREAVACFDGTELPARRYFAHGDDASIEAGPEWWFDKDARVIQANFQVASKVDGYRIQRTVDGPWTIASFIAGALDGLIWLLRPDGTLKEIQRVRSARLTGVHSVDERGMLTMLTGDGNDQDRNRRGRWDFFDAENHVVRTYEHGKPKRVEFRRIADDTLEQTVDHVAEARTHTLYADNGTSITASGPVNAKSERTGTWSHFDAFGARCRTVTYDPPNVPVAEWTRPDELLRPQRRFEYARDPSSPTTVDELMDGVPMTQRLIIDSVAAATRPWKKRVPCRELVVRDASDDALLAAFAHPRFAKIDTLNLCDASGEVGDTFVAASRAGTLAHLRSVMLDHVKSLTVLEVILDGLPRLECLQLRTLPLSDGELAQLLARPGLASVKVLELAGCDAGIATARVIAGGALPALAALRLSYVPVGDDALRVLASAPAMQRLERFRYHASTCGDHRAPNIALTEHARPVLERICAIESLAAVDIGLSLVEVAVKPVDDVEPILAGEPSLDAFRQLWASVEARPELLETVVARIAAWPAAIRIAPPYTINKLVDGRIRAAFLALARGLHVFELMLDESTNLPVTTGMDARIAALITWLGSLGDEANGIETLDFSPEGWRATFKPFIGPRFDGCTFAMTKAAWSAMFRKFGGVRVLSLSQSDVPYDVTCRYHREFAFFPQLDDDLPIERLLRDAPMAACLEELYLQGFTRSKLRADAFPELPNLRVLDLSGKHRRAAVGFGAKAPRLATLILGGSPLVRFALEGGKAKALAVDRIASQAELEGLLIGESDLRALVEALPRLEAVLLGGEVGCKKVRAAKKAWPFAVRDARGRDDRRWLPW